MADGLRLFFLRHGRADRDQYDGDDDALRPLVASGRERMRVTAEVLARLTPDLDALFTSPLLRAAQTAEIVARRLGRLDALHTDARLGPGFDVGDVASLLAGLRRDHRRIMLVGHEPDFSLVIGELTGAAAVMRKGALARVDLTPGGGHRGRLIWLLQPRVLLACGDPGDPGGDEDD